MVKTGSKILIIGFGSIGQRHWRNLRASGYHNISVYDTEPNKLKAVSNKLNAISIKALQKFQVVFVCSPNNLHIKHALLAAQAGCHIFIEKPLSQNLKGAGRLADICRRKNLATMVACDMRFHPCLRFIKSYLDKKALGRVYSVSHEYGYYLPYWRPGVDYRKNYSAKKALGGGIILDDVHEFDLLFWLNNFSEVAEKKSLSARLSDLEIETEDICAAIYKFKNNVIGAVKCDYLQKKGVRSCAVVGEKGTLSWNTETNAVKLSDEKRSRIIFKPKNFSDNCPYVDEIKYFLSKAGSGQKTFNDVGRAKWTISNLPKTV